MNPEAMKQGMQRAGNALARRLMGEAPAYAKDDPNSPFNKAQAKRARRGEKLWRDHSRVAMRGR